MVKKGRSLPPRILLHRRKDLRGHDQHSDQNQAAGDAKQHANHSISAGEIGFLDQFSQEMCADRAENQDQQE